SPARSSRPETRRDRRGNILRRGDKVKVVDTPQGLRNAGDLQTKTIFELCRGRIFQIVGFQGDGVHEDWVEVHVGRVVGEPSFKHSIWIEPSLVEVVES